MVVDKTHRGSVQGQHGMSQMSKTGAPRPRDAEQTRQSLIVAARNRFALDGYAATTVREIASDAGVNVALINRYFQSKEGLFEACLSSAADALTNADDELSDLTHLADAIADRVTLAASEGDLANTLLLLLRSSGDERADRIRVDMLRAFGETLARVAGWTPGQADADELPLRAQLVLASAIGTVALRSAGLEPMASVNAIELSGQMRRLVEAVLGASESPRSVPQR
jgi:AcrR family transcriptional regulator